MKFETDYIKKSYKENLLGIWVMTGLGLFCFSFAWIAFMVSFFYSDEISGKHSFIKGLDVGLRHYSMSHFLESLCLFLGLCLLFYLVIKNLVKNRRIVVAIDFCDEKKHITIFKLEFNKRIIKEGYPQEKLFYKINLEEKDMISNENYECINLIHKNNIVGRIFLKHFTWQSNATTTNMTETLYQWITPTKNCR